MSENGSVITVYFEEPFWVCRYERWEEAGLQVCKITFGAEPAPGEVYAWLLQNWHRLRFTPPVPGAPATRWAKNPKRRQRLIKKQLENPGTGTRAQNALKAQQQAGGLERKKKARDENHRRAEERFAQKQQKRREKHKGH